MRRTAGIRFSLVKLGYTIRWAHSESGYHRLFVVHDSSILEPRKRGARRISRKGTVMRITKGMGLPALALGTLLVFFGPGAALAGDHGGGGGHGFSRGPGA